MGEPPLSEGALQARRMFWLPDRAVGAVGAPGMLDGVADTILDAVPWPLELAALMRNSYFMPFVRPVTRAEVDVPVPSWYVFHVPDDILYWTV